MYFVTPPTDPTDKRKRNIEERLVRRYEDFARKVAEHYYPPVFTVDDLSPVFTVDDLYQECIIALIQTIRKTDPLLLGAFPSYASKRINGAVNNFWRQIGPLSPYTMRFVNKIVMIMQEQGKMPPIDEICRITGLRPKSARILVNIIRSGIWHNASLDQPLNTGGESLVDLISDHATSKEALEKLDLQDAINHLPPRQQRVIQGFIDGLSNLEIAQQLGTSRAIVNRLLKEAVRKLEKMLSEPVEKDASGSSIRLKNEPPQIFEAVRREDCVWQFASDYRIPFRERQQHILLLLLQGKTIDEIAMMLGISKMTVKNHIAGSTANALYSVASKLCGKRINRLNKLMYELASLGYIRVRHNGEDITPKEWKCSEKFSEIISPTRTELREVFEFYIRGLSIKEIARTKNKTPASIKNQIWIIMNIIREYILQKESQKGLQKKI